MLISVDMLARVNMRIVWMLRRDIYGLTEMTLDLLKSPAAANPRFLTR
ncbi:hypothetical protein C100_20995 [Sphingobium sp. C100]|nr:hypothetical protein C100_20995 [Sphingobium sp. C100]